MSINFQSFRQGDTFNFSDFKDIPRINLNVIEKDICVLITQDCDIYNSDYKKEPFLEFIFLEQKDSLNKQYEKGKNPRLLQIEENEKIFEFSIHNRFFIRKSDINGLPITQKQDLYLSSSNIRILNKWMGKRYTRASFAGSFNKRIKEFQVNIPKDTLADHISYIFFDVTDEEKESLDDSYELKVLVIVDDISFKQKVSDLFTANLSKPGIELEKLEILEESFVTLDKVKKYKRWEQDCYSIENGIAAPADDFDSIN